MGDGRVSVSLFGDQFLTVYPNLNASVKDVKDKEGKVTVATAKMLTANKGKSRLGASVSIKFFDVKCLGVPLWVYVSL